MFFYQSCSAALRSLPLQANVFISFIRCFIFLQMFNYKNAKPRVNNMEIIHAFKESKEADSRLLSQRALWFI